MSSLQPSSALENHQARWAAAVMAQLEHLLNLEEDWDSYGSPPPTSRADLGEEPAAVLEKVQHQAAVTQKDPDAFYQAFEPSVARQAQHPQVLAIGADWVDSPLSDVVTRLAKVQLHRTCTELSSRGFDVCLARINRTPSPSNRRRVAYRGDRRIRLS